MISPLTKDPPLLPGIRQAFTGSVAGILLGLYWVQVGQGRGGEMKAHCIPLGDREQHIFIAGQHNAVQDAPWLPAGHLVVSPSFIPL